MRFFSPPEKPRLTGRFSMSCAMLSFFDASRTRFMKSGVGQLAVAARLALGVERRLEKGHGGDAGDLQWILEHQEQAERRAFGRILFQQVHAVEFYGPFRHFVVRAAGDDIGQRRLAGAVRPHDRGDLAGVHRQAQPVDDFFAGDGDVEIVDFKHE